MTAEQGSRLSPRLVEALNERLYQWALLMADGRGAPGTSPIYALMVGRVQNPRQGDRVLIDDAATAEIEAAMAAIKRESPRLYAVLSVEAFSLLGGDRLALQRGRARRLRISERTYRERLRMAREFLTGLLFGPLIQQQQRARAGQ